MANLRSSTDTIIHKPGIRSWNIINKLYINSHHEQQTMRMNIMFDYNINRTNLYFHGIFSKDSINTMRKAHLSHDIKYNIFDTSQRI